MDNKNTYGSTSIYNNESSNNKGIKVNFWRIWKIIFPRSYKDEVLGQFSMAWPTILTSFSRFFTLSVSIMFCGHLDKLQLDAAALANSLINVFGLAINLGFSTACDTLFSQTFGSKNKKKTGLYLQRAFVVVLPVLFLMTAFYLNAEVLLVFIGQDRLISSMAADYLAYFLPGLYFDCFFVILARYLQNQNIVYPPMCAGLCSIVFNVLAQYITIYVFNQNYRASAVCQACAYVVAFCFTLSYILISKVYKVTWDGFRPLQMWFNIGSFYVIGIAGILMVALEEWGFEAGVFISGTLGTIELGAQSIILQIESLAFMIPLGLSVVVNIRLGNCLGAGDAVGARHVYRVGLTVALITATIMVTFLMSLSNQITMLYTNDKDIIKMVAGVIKLLAIFQYIDGIAAVSSGALRGCGRQIIAAVMVFIGFYVISFPVGLVLAVYTPYGVEGIWIGLIGGMGTEAVAFSFLVHCSNWEAECEKVKTRNSEYDNLPAIEIEGDSSDMEDEEDTRLITTSKHLESLSHKRNLSTMSGSRFIGKEIISKKRLSHRRSTAFSMEFKRNANKSSSGQNKFIFPATTTNPPFSSSSEDEEDSIGGDGGGVVKSSSGWPREGEKSLIRLIVKRSILYIVFLCILFVSLWYRQNGNRHLFDICIPSGVNYTSLVNGTIPLCH